MPVLLLVAGHALTSVRFSRRPIFQMLGVEELRRGNGGGGESGSVSAPKIARFCEDYLDLVGRLVASRLMLELSPFMDSSVAGTASAPTGSTRAELVATRRKLDEVNQSSKLAP